MISSFIQRIVGGSSKKPDKNKEEKMNISYKSQLLENNNSNEEDMFDINPDLGKIFRSLPLNDKQKNPAEKDKILEYLDINLKTMHQLKGFAILHDPRERPNSYNRNLRFRDIFVNDQFLKNITISQETCQWVAKNNNLSSSKAKAMVTFIMSYGDRNLITISKKEVDMVCVTGELDRLLRVKSNDPKTGMNMYLNILPKFFDGSYYESCYPSSSEKSNKKEEKILLRKEEEDNDKFLDGEKSPNAESDANVLFYQGYVEEAQLLIRVLDELVLKEYSTKKIPWNNMWNCDISTEKILDILYGYYIDDNKGSKEKSKFKDRGSVYLLINNGSITLQFYKWMQLVCSNKKILSVMRVIFTDPRYKTQFLIENHKMFILISLDKMKLEESYTMQNSNGTIRKASQKIKYVRFLYWMSEEIIEEILVMGYKYNGETALIASYNHYNLPHYIIMLANSTHEWDSESNKRKIEKYGI